jgi:predicted nucleic acid-binding protein
VLWEAAKGERAKMEPDNLVMKPVGVRTVLLDASALVKFYINEEHSADVRAYLKGHPNWYTTPFCLFEALGVLKRKYNSKEITQDEYHKAGREMLAEYEARSRDNPGIESFVNPFVFSHIESMCRKYPKIDFSDAFQILSVKGKDSVRWGDSRPMLITADGQLAKAVEKEGLEVKLFGRNTSQG